jgi:hypothetical protein
LSKTTLLPVAQQGVPLLAPKGWSPKRSKAIEVEGRGSMTISWFHEPRPNRFVVRLNHEFEESMTLDVLAGDTRRFQP